MGGFDDHVAIIGDWMPPSPSPRSFFSAMMGDNVGSRSISELAGDNKNEAHFLEQGDEHELGSADEKGHIQACVGGGQVTNVTAFCEQKMSLRGGLLERMAARAGFNAPRLNTQNIRSAELSQNPGLKSPYLTIPPGLSPTTLLDSPVFLANSLVQSSPTTGKFPLTFGGVGRSTTLITEATDKSSENSSQDADNSIFAFKPVTESRPSLFLGSASKETPIPLAHQSFHNVEVAVQSENSILSQSAKPSKVHLQDSGSKLHHLQSDFPQSNAEKGDSNISSEARALDLVGGTAEHPLSLDKLPDEDTGNRGNEDPNVGNAPSEDGYNWRKYGQKQVKGSEYPRSYYKCTHPNCPVKKKVERSQDGHITEIIYKGAHKHPKPPPNRRSAIGSSSGLSDMQLDIPEQVGAGTDGRSVWTSMQNGTSIGGPDWKQDNFEVTSSSALGPEYHKASAFLHGVTQGESVDAVDVSSTFSNDEDEDDRATHGSVSLGYDGEGDESESKRRKIEAYAADMSGATRAIREPRVVVQTTSDVDILDDGYRWRKYGQKVVKGNPNPRSYYKCTSAGCTVRKHVERASHDLKSVITTYEGKHNHDVPVARSNSHVNSAIANTSAQVSATASAQTQIHHLSEPTQLHNGITRFERPPPSLGSFILPGRQQLGPSQGFAFGMNQAGLANLSMSSSLGHNPGRLPTPLPVHPYLGQAHPIGEMGFMVPKSEPLSEPGMMNLSNGGSSVYHQIMSRLPLGPQM